MEAMKIGILGTGMVGDALGTKLASLGHDVMMGSRDAHNPKSVGWAAKNKGRAGTMVEAAAHGQLVFNCTHGTAGLEIARTAGDALADKILVDVANPLDFSHGMPPTLSIVNTDSMGESLQRALPRTRVVKTLNTVNCKLMVEPSRVPGEHVLFVSGNDAGAKRLVRAVLESWGWRDIIDLGDITSARATEQLLPVWLRLWGVLGTTDFNFAVARQGA